MNKYKVFSQKKASNNPFTFWGNYNKINIAYKMAEEVAKSPLILNVNIVSNNGDIIVIKGESLYTNK